MTASQIGMTARVEPDLAKPGAFRVAITLDVADIKFAEQNGKRSATVIMATRLGSSKEKTAKTETLSISVSEERYRVLLSQGVTVTSVVSAEKADRFQVVVQDRATGWPGRRDGTLPRDARRRVRSAVRRPS